MESLSESHWNQEWSFSTCLEMLTAPPTRPLRPIARLSCRGGCQVKASPQFHLTLSNSPTVQMKGGTAEHRRGSGMLHYVEKLEATWATKAMFHRLSFALIRTSPTGLSQAHTHSASHKATRGNANPNLTSG